VCLVRVEGVNLARGRELGQGDGLPGLTIVACQFTLARTPDLAIIPWRQERTPASRQAVLAGKQGPIVLREAPYCISPGDPELVRVASRKGSKGALRFRCDRFPCAVQTPQVPIAIRCAEHSERVNEEMRSAGGPALCGFQRAPGIGRI